MRQSMNVDSLASYHNLSAGVLSGFISSTLCLSTHSFRCCRHSYYESNMGERFESKSTVIDGAVIGNQDANVFTIRVAETRLHIDVEHVC
jgi:hypothetical protein